MAIILDSHAHLTYKEYEVELLNIALRSSLQLANKVLTPHIKHSTRISFAELTVKYLTDYANYLDYLHYQSGGSKKTLPSNRILRVQE